jgi:hypothetical protein
MGSTFVVFMSVGVEVNIYSYFNFASLVILVIGGILFNWRVSDEFMAVTHPPPLANNAVGNTGPWFTDSLTFTNTLDVLQPLGNRLLPNIADVDR